MTTMASQITSLTVVYSTVYSDADQRKHQSFTSLALVWGIHRDRWIPRTKGQLRGKCVHLMTSLCTMILSNTLCLFGTKSSPWPLLNCQWDESKYTPILYSESNNFRSRQNISQFSMSIYQIRTLRFDGLSCWMTDDDQCIYFSLQEFYLNFFSWFFILIFYLNF